ncbi:DMT family transporter [Actinomadura sp. HBU206391]|uniref:DMT family transporter n=1 Tax=Actinomadura sp. HBU206391 TaxID=2731692 RepID=UPI00164F53F5|nr:EamA family transporter [Actinomadura sp. HBU206391]MBC6457545.1 EamA family transporter [Actinomadura sp. HBU206391]
MNSSANARGMLGAASAMFLVGTLTGVSATIQDYPVFGGQALRYALAALVLLAAARLHDRRAPRGRTAARSRRAGRTPVRDVLLLVALAATGLAGFNVFVVMATRHTSPSTVGTVIATVPVVLALLGPLLERRRPAPLTVAAALVVTAGAALANGLGGGSLTGLLLSMGALAGEIGFSLLAVPLLPRLGPIRVSAYAAALAVPMLIIAGLIADGRGFVRLPTAGEAAALLYLSAIVTTVAFFLWYDALGRLGADRAGLFAGVIPVSAAIITVVLGLGRPGPAELAGVGLVALGVVTGLAPRRRIRVALAAP